MKVYFAKKKLAPRSLMGWDSGEDMLMEPKGGVRDENSEDGALLCGDLGQVVSVPSIKTKLDCSIWRAFRITRSDSSRNKT